MRVCAGPTPVACTLPGMNTHSRRARHGHGALILIVLITLAIVLYLMFGSTGGGSGGGSGGGTSYMGQVSKTRSNAKGMAADISTQQLSILIAQYRQENNKLPSGPGDFDNAGAFKDPWGGPLSFSFSEERGKTSVTYKSNGPDGEAGTEDDVTKTDTLPF